MFRRRGQRGGDAAPGQRRQFPGGRSHRGRGRGDRPGPALHRQDLLVTVDGAGALHALIGHLTRLNTANPSVGHAGQRVGPTVDYSIGWPVDERTRKPIDLAPQVVAWSEAVHADGHEEADGIDLTGLVRASMHGDSYRLGRRTGGRSADGFPKFPGSVPGPAATGLTTAAPGHSTSARSGPVEARLRTTSAQSIGTRNQNVPLIRYNNLPPALLPTKNQGRAAVDRIHRPGHTQAILDDVAKGQAAVVSRHKRRRLAPLPSRRYGQAGYATDLGRCPATPTTNFGMPTA